jgi:hypothetical protein
MSRSSSEIIFIFFLGEILSVSHTTPTIRTVAMLCFFFTYKEC